MASSITELVCGFRDGGLSMVRGWGEGAPSCAGRQGGRCGGGGRTGWGCRPWPWGGALLPTTLARDVVVSGSSDRCLRLWGRVSGVRVGEVEVVGTLHSLMVIDTRVFVASTNRTITIVDLLQLRVTARCVGNLNLFSNHFALPFL